MKTFRTLLIVSLFIAGFAQQTYAKKLQTYVSYVTFYSPADGPYIETYLAFAGKSIHFVKNDKNKFVSNIEVTMIFSQNNKVVEFGKYFVKIPDQDDTLNVKNFVDQHRYILPNGNYSMEIEIVDKNSTNKPIRGKDSISINFPKDKILLSGIQPLENYTPTVTPTVYSKSGFDLSPMVLNFYPESVNKITYYTEIYNAEQLLGSNEKFITKCYLETFESKNELTDFELTKRETAKPVNVILQEFKIDNLPSGNYNLVVEIRDKENNIISVNKMFFQRSNPKLNIKTDFETLAINNSFVEKIINRDSLTYFIRCLYPISTEIEKTLAQNLIKNDNEPIIKLQKYILKFWMDRNYTNPELAWNNYYKEVIKVNNSFSNGSLKGYLTDRGRVYLQYGPPNSILQAPFDQNCYPYEIWHYYTIGNQTNKKFVFYTNDIASYNYELINSNANGEISDLNWMNKIIRPEKYKTDPFTGKQPDEDVLYGGKLLDNFKNY